VSNENCRIVNVNFLNGSPFSEASSLDQCEYSEVVPSEGARMLHERECDLALIPTAEFLSHGAYGALPFGIASEGSVESVLLLGTETISAAKQLFVDRRSHSSVALLTILWNQIAPSDHRNQRPDLHRIDADEIPQRIDSESAGLVIGDKALELRHQFPLVIDLGQLWQQTTGLPFVYAVWAYRPGSISPDLISRVCSAFARGVEIRSEKARAWALAHNQDIDLAISYVSQSIRYDLSSEKLEGLKRFWQMGASCKALPDILGRHEETLIEPSDSACRSWSLQKPSLDTLLSAASEGMRISLEDALRLANECSLSDLGMAADCRKSMIHPEPLVSYIIDRNINYTNVCNVYCRFCAFYTPAHKKESGYILSKQDLAQKIEETLAVGGKQILLQGGLHPDLGIDYYEELFSWIRKRYPEVNLHALSSDEICHIAKVSSLSLETTLARLIASGLGSLPGGGAEILVDKIRHRIARLKTSASEWLEVHRTAHRLGITSTCTMMFGVGESWEDRISHLHKLRTLQDETSGFTAFIAWPFQHLNTKLQAADTSSPEYLRVQCIARLFLDNIANIQSSWVTQGPSVGQLALFYGANDFGSVMLEENVVSAAGTSFSMTEEGIQNQIRAAGFIPWERDVHYKEA